MKTVWISVLFLCLAIGQVFAVTCEQDCNSAQANGCSINAGGTCLMKVGTECTQIKNNTRANHFIPAKEGKRDWDNFKAVSNKERFVFSACPVVVVTPPPPVVPPTTPVQDQELMCDCKVTTPNNQQMVDNCTLSPDLGIGSVSIVPKLTQSQCQNLNDCFKTPNTQAIFTDQNCSSGGQTSGGTTTGGTCTPPPAGSGSCMVSEIYNHRNSDCSDRVAAMPITESIVVSSSAECYRLCDCNSGTKYGGCNFAASSSCEPPTTPPSPPATGGTCTIGAYIEYGERACDRTGPFSLPMVAGETFDVANKYECDSKCGCDSSGLRENIDCTYQPNSGGSTTGGCNETGWAPDPAQTCSTESVAQTSNCGTTRTVQGTKTCAPVCDANTTAHCECFFQWTNPGAIETVSMGTMTSASCESLVSTSRGSATYHKCEWDGCNGRTFGSNPGQPARVLCWQGGPEAGRNDCVIAGSCSASGAIQRTKCKDSTRNNGETYEAYYNLICQEASSLSSNECVQNGGGVTGGTTGGGPINYCDKAASTPCSGVTDWYDCSCSTKTLMIQKRCDGSAVRQKSYISSGCEDFGNE